MPKKVEIVIDGKSVELPVLEASEGLSVAHDKEVQAFRSQRTNVNLIGGGRRTSVNEKWPAAYGVVMPASVANCDAIAGVGNGIFREGLRYCMTIACSNERNAID